MYLCISYLNYIAVAQVFDFYCICVSFVLYLAKKLIGCQMGHETGAYIAHHTTLLGNNNQQDLEKTAQIKQANLITPHWLEQNYQGLEKKCATKNVNSITPYCLVTATHNGPWKNIHKLNYKFKAHQSIAVGKQKVSQTEEQD